MSIKVNFASLCIELLYETNIKKKNISEVISVYNYVFFLGGAELLKGFLDSFRQGFQRWTNLQEAYNIYIYIYILYKHVTAYDINL